MNIVAATRCLYEIASSTRFVIELAQLKSKWWSGGGGGENGGNGGGFGGAFGGGCMGTGGGGDEFFPFKMSAYTFPPLVVSSTRSSW